MFKENVLVLNKKQQQPCMCVFLFWKSFNLKTYLRKLKITLIKAILPCFKILVSFSPTGTNALFLSSTLSHAHRWFFGKISRRDCERHLLRVGNIQGTFMIRESETQIGKLQLVGCTCTFYMRVLVYYYCCFCCYCFCCYSSKKIY